MIPAFFIWTNDNHVNGRIYRLRFLPEQAGVYRYHVYGCAEAEGSFSVEPAEPDFHGMVRAAGTRFVFAGGRDCHPFETTVYALFQPFFRALTFIAAFVTIRIACSEGESFVGNDKPDKATG